MTTGKTRTRRATVSRREPVNASAVRRSSRGLRSILTIFGLEREPERSVGWSDGCSNTLDGTPKSSAHHATSKRAIEGMAITGDVFASSGFTLSQLSSALDNIARVFGSGPGPKNIGGRNKEKLHIEDIKD